MSRNPTLTFKQALFAQETDKVFAVLLEIRSGTPPNYEYIRANNSGEDITSNSEIFPYYPFDINLPSDEAENVPQAKLTIDDVDQTLIEAIRELDHAPTVRLMVVLADNPDTVEVDFADFTFTNIGYDALTITGTISVENFMSEPFPGDTIVPSKFIALF